MTSTTKTVLRAVTGVVVAALLVLGGFLLGMNPEIASNVRDFFSGNGSTYSEEYLELQEEVLRKLESSYYKEFDPKALWASGIDGMLAGLGDPYTVYMEPDEYSTYLEKISGTYIGVGITVEMKDRLVTVISIFKGSPAQLAGIQAGDVILSVDGVSTEGENLHQVVGRIRGPEGTAVTLEMYRFAPSITTTVAGEGEDDRDSEPSADTDASTADSSFLPSDGETTEYTLTRKKITMPVTESEILDVDGRKVAFISLFAFTEGSGEALRDEVERSVEDGRVTAIILDLRGNGGGLLNEAIDVASIFIPSGVIVSTEGLHSREQVYSATGGAYALVPLYVLTGQYTASASEIVSGALQDYDRALLVGETTFGKGLVQSILALSNGGAITVTTAVYLTPGGRDINEAGIEPDVVAPDDPETADVDEGLEAVVDLISAGTTVME